MHAVVSIRLNIVHTNPEKLIQDKCTIFYHTFALSLSLFPPASCRNINISRCRVRRIPYH